MSKRIYVVKSHAARTMVKHIAVATQNDLVAATGVRLKI